MHHFAYHQQYMIVQAIIYSSNIPWPFCCSPFGNIFYIVSLFSLDFSLFFTLDNIYCSIYKFHDSLLSHFHCFNFKLSKWIFISYILFFSSRMSFGSFYYLLTCLIIFNSQSLTSVRIVTMAVLKSWLAHSNIQTD